MEHLFTNYKQGLALKEIGFDEPCLYPFQNNYDDRELSRIDSCYADYKNWNDKRYGVVSAPLKSQVFHWARKFNIYANTWSTRSFSNSFKIIHWDSGCDSSHIYHSKQNFQNIEESENACIDAIIELIKNLKTD